MDLIMDETASYSRLNNENDPSRIERLSLLETAMEIMASMCGHAGIKQVNATLRGDLAEAEQIAHETKELLVIRDAIYRGEGDAIDRAIKEFGPVIKARFLAA